MKFVRINPIKVEGSRYEMEVGYSEHVRLKLKGKFSNPLLTAKINPFGIKDRKDLAKKNIFGSVEEKQDCLSFNTKTTGPKIKGFILGITTVILGEDIWGPRTGFELGQIKEYNKIKISTKWDFKVKTGFADLVYDIWLNKSRKGRCSAQDVEIMVWLDSNFEIPWKEIGKFKNFKVKYMKKTKEDHPNDPGHTFAFILKSKKRQKDFDYREMIEFCSNYLIRDLRSYWIRSIYLGTEYSKNTEVRANIYKANFSFE